MLVGFEIWQVGLELNLMDSLGIDIWSKRIFPVS